MSAVRQARPQRLTRAEAAAMLRAARATSPSQPDQRGELVGWALSAMPERSAARRLKIDYLLDIGHYDAADALIARCLMQGQGRAAGPMMRLRLARSLHAQRRMEQADCEIRLVLAVSPDHVRALILGARIARDLGRPLAAIQLLERACEIRPGRIDVRCEFVHVLLEAELVDRASHELAQLTAPPAILSARVLRAQYRTLEAVELLERSVAGANHVAKPSLVIELIEALEELGDSSRLEVALDSAQSENASTLLRSATSLLSHSQARAAIDICTRVRASQPCHRQALPILLAAQVADGDVCAAHITLEQFGELTNCTNPAAMASLWLDAFEGELLFGGGTARSAGRDPAMSLLRPMLRQSAAILQSRIDGDRFADQKISADSLHQHLAVCVTALQGMQSPGGLACESASVLKRSARPVATPSETVTAPLRRAA